MHHAKEIPTLYFLARSGNSSVSTLANVIEDDFVSEILERTGKSDLHGPHHLCDKGYISITLLKSQPIMA